MPKPTDPTTPTKRAPLAAPINVADVLTDDEKARAIDAMARAAAERAAKSPTINVHLHTYEVDRLVAIGTEVSTTRGTLSTQDRAVMISTLIAEAPGDPEYTPAWFAKASDPLIAAIYPGCVRRGREKRERADAAALKARADAATTTTTTTPRTDEDRARVAEERVRVAEERARNLEYGAAWNNLEDDESLTSDQRRNAKRALRRRYDSATKAKTK